MSEQSKRAEILEMVAAYAKEYHGEREYKKGDRIGYAGRVYDEKEMVSLVDSALDFWLTSGKYAQKLEMNLCEYLGVKYSLLVNSGSSANLLAFMALTSPLLGERRVLPGDEVITVAATFPTTISPIVQYGAIPVFTDITIPEYNIDVTALDQAVSPKTKAVMIAHTLGNPFDLQQVKDFCDKHNLWLIEDNCDALGSKYIYNGEERFTGTVGDIGTSSFYPPHHITMGEGGAVYTDNPILNKIMLSMRDWGRYCVCPSGKDNLCEHRFDGEHGIMPKGYDHKYIYSHFGYNLKVTEMQAAIGVEQLKKVPAFTEARRNHWKSLYSKLEGKSDKLLLPVEVENGDACWFGFMITCTEEGLRDSIVAHLEYNNIQTRMLFAGNIVRQPCFDEMREEKKGYRVVGELTNTDYVMQNSFWVGVYPGMTEQKISVMADEVIKATQNFRR